MTIAQVMNQVLPLLSPSGQIRRPDLVDAFVRSMKENSTADVSILAYYANVLVATRPPAILSAFTQSSGPLILRAWHARCLKSPEVEGCIRLMRQLILIYRSLPLTLSLLAELKLGKLVVRTISVFSDSETKALAIACEKQWRGLLNTAEGKCLLLLAGQRRGGLLLVWLK